jgi:hypothetical protein
MSKIVEIEYCGDCPHRYYKGNDLCCELDILYDRVIYENKPIPDWCPMDDEYTKKDLGPNGKILTNKELQELVKLLLENLQCPCGCTYEMSLNEPCACNWTPISDWFTDRNIEFYFKKE